MCEISRGQDADSQTYVLLVAHAELQDSIMDVGGQQGVEE